MAAEGVSYEQINEQPRITLDYKRIANDCLKFLFVLYILSWILWLNFAMSSVRTLQIIGIVMLMPGLLTLLVLSCMSVAFFMSLIFFYMRTHWFIETHADMPDTEIEMTQTV